jgi:hypothetical protein
MGHIAVVMARDALGGCSHTILCSENSGVLRSWFIAACTTMNLTGLPGDARRRIHKVVLTGASARRSSESATTSCPVAINMEDVIFPRFFGYPRTEPKEPG